MSCSVTGPDLAHASAHRRRHQHRARTSHYQRKPPNHEDHELGAGVLTLAVGGVAVASVAWPVGQAAGSSQLDVRVFSIGDSSTSLLSDTQTRDFSTEWKPLDLTGSPIGVSFTVPSGVTAMVRIRVTAAVGCHGGDGRRDACALRFVLDGQPNTIGGGQWAGADGLGNFSEYDRSNTTEAVASGLSCGSHTVRVEWAILNAGGGTISYYLSHLVLTVEIDRAA
jgi:hypothetical protein